MATACDQRLGGLVALLALLGRVLPQDAEQESQVHRSKELAEVAVVAQGDRAASAAQQSKQRPAHLDEREFVALEGYLRLLQDVGGIVARHGADCLGVAGI